MRYYKIIYFVSLDQLSVLYTMIARYSERRVKALINNDVQTCQPVMARSSLSRAAGCARERAKLNDRSAKRCGIAHRRNICDSATSIAIYLRIDGLEHGSSSTRPGVRCTIAKNCVPFLG